MLNKKTKQEIMDEYAELLEKYEDLKAAAKAVNSQEAVSRMNLVKDYTVDNIGKSIQELKTALNSSLSDLSGKIFSEAEKLSEIQKAVELSKQHLELNYHIQVAAETLERLVAEYEAKKKGLEHEHQEKQFALEQEIADKKRDWKREQEEYSYSVKLDRKREEEKFQEEQVNKEKDLAQRLGELKKAEGEFHGLKEQAEGFPRKLEISLNEKEQEVTERLEQNFSHQLERERREWQAKQDIYELKLSTLQEQIKQNLAEMAQLRQDAERANSKAQDLAAKVIENTSTVLSSARSQAEEGKKTNI